MKWKLTHKDQHECIENEGGKTLSYDPNLGIQIIERDGYAFKDLNNNGELDPFEDWRNPMSVRIKDFSNRFALWQEEDCLYYRKGPIQMPEEFRKNMEMFRDRETLSDLLNGGEENLEYLEKNYILALLLLMFDNDFDTGREDALLQLIMQSMDLGLLENIVYSLWEALKKFVAATHYGQVQRVVQP